MPGRGGGHGRGVKHQGGCVVEERLTFEDGEQPARHPEPPAHAGRGGRVGGTDGRPEHEGDGPGQVAEPVCYCGYGERGGDDQ